MSTEEAQNPEIFEQIGDLEAGRQHIAEARAAYQSALKFAADGAAHKRINNKLKQLASK
jgi:predicted negative regulator of RcsB-dependent stress response